MVSLKGGVSHFLRTSAALFAFPLFCHTILIFVPCVRLRCTVRRLHFQLLFLFLFLFLFFYVLQNIPKKKARVHLSHPLCFLFISVKKRKYMKLFLFFAIKKSRGKKVSNYKSTKQKSTTPSIASSSSPFSPLPSLRTLPPPFRPFFNNALFLVVASFRSGMHCGGEAVLRKRCEVAEGRAV